MRRFAPALRGQFSRRKLALSPHIWTATGGMFGIYALANLVIGLAFPAQVHRVPVLLLGVALGAIAIRMALSRPPEPGGLTTHAVLAAAYLGSATSVAVYAPHGSASVVAGLFTAPLLAFWLTDRRLIAAHLCVATAALLAAATITGNDDGTLFAAITFSLASWVMTASCVVVFETFEAQGEEYHRLAMRDALTGTGNATWLRDALHTEVVRHRSLGEPLVLVELQVGGIDAINNELGRSAGDGVLTAIAAVLSDTAPQVASVARIDGDRFAVVLPATTRADGDAFVERVRQRLTLLQTGQTTLTTRAGLAAFPIDADHTAPLLEVAHRRANRSPAEHRERGVQGRALGGLQVQHDDVRPLPPVHLVGAPSPDARQDWVATRVDRRGLAQDPLVWRAFGGALAGFALIAAAAMLIDRAVAEPAVLAVTAAAFIAGLLPLVIRPPAIGSSYNHLVVAVMWVLPLAAMVACAPHASWAASTAALAGVGIGTRFTDRRQIAAHLIAMTTLAGALLLSGRVDFAAVLATLTLLLSTWVLVVCAVTIFEAAEMQAERMEDLVLIDPATGAGNARLLRERLADELPRHRDMQMPLVLIEVALNGFDALHAHEGRGAANDVLRDVAVILGSEAEEHATISRVTGNRFRMLLPLTGADDVAEMIDGLRIAIAATPRRRGRALLPKVGVATFPDDATSGEQLTRIASERCTADDSALAVAIDDNVLSMRRAVDQRPSTTADHDRRRSSGW